MLVYFEPAKMCEDVRAGFVLAPLPAKKQLWQAGDERMWKAENDREPDAQAAFGLAANGELVQLGREQRLLWTDDVLVPKSLEAVGLGKTASWEDWCAGMDGFGGLVMLAASLNT